MRSGSPGGCSERQTTRHHSLGAGTAGQYLGIGRGGSRAESPLDAVLDSPSS